MEYNEEHGGAAAAAAAAGLKKSPSEASFASIELHLPRRRGGDGGSGAGGGAGAAPGGVMIDKECLSMKSDCGMDIRRRFSIVNATGKKVSSTVLFITIQCAARAAKNICFVRFLFFCYFT